MDGEALTQTESSSDSGLAPQLKPFHFPKGVSGNPGGRSKGKAEFNAACREHTEEAIQTLLGVMRKEKAMSSAKVQAARTLLSYAWGAPKDADEADGGKIIINILKMAIGNGHDPEPMVSVQRLTNGNGADHA